MTTGTILEYLHARPFQPLRLYLADGRELRVPHPDFLTLSPNGREAAIFLAGDEHQVISLLLVTGLGAQGDPPRTRTTSGEEG